MTIVVDGDRNVFKIQDWERYVHSSQRIGPYIDENGALKKKIN